MRIVNYSNVSDCRGFGCTTNVLKAMDETDRVFINLINYAKGKRDILWVFASGNKATL